MTEYTANEALIAQAATRAAWAAALAPSATRRAPIQRKTRGFFARLLGR